MRWFRNTIKQGTWLALIALAVNLGLSFGHFHAFDGNAGRGMAAVSIAVADEGGKQGNPNDSHADYLCPICMAATAMAAGLTSTPPALPLQFDHRSIDRTIEPVLAFVDPSRAAFQPRGPPIS